MGDSVLSERADSLIILIQRFSELTYQFYLCDWFQVESTYNNLEYIYLHLLNLGDSTSLNLRTKFERYTRKLQQQVSAKDYDYIGLSFMTLQVSYHKHKRGDYRSLLAHHDLKHFENL
jgi:hypothetical protein